MNKTKTAFAWQERKEERRAARRAVAGLRVLGKVECWRMLIGTGFVRNAIPVLLSGV